MRAEARGMVAGLVRRDLTVVLRSRAVIMPIVIVPLVLFIALPGMVIAGIRFGSDELAELAFLIGAMPEALRRQLGGGTVEQQLLAYLLEFQFATLFLIVPLMVAAVMAADSFAGEKERKTLEALLYTPTSDLELYVAKLLGPWIAAVVVAGVGYVLYAIAINLLTAGETARVLAVTPFWALVVLWLSPAVAALGLGVLVQVSARVRGFQEAYQLGSIIVLPLVLLIVAQLAGLLFIDTLLAVGLGALIWLIAGVILWLGYRAFRRERLLLSA